MLTAGTETSLTLPPCAIIIRASRFRKAVPMIRALFLCVALFQAGSPTASKPIIDNDRIAVWDVTDSAAAQPTDAVVVSLSGNAAYGPKGTAPKIDGRSIGIGFKDHPRPTYTNTTG